jgi:uncharacterized protein YajQ (UPF0234 family)
MAKDETFDITTGADLQEVANAVDQAKREITQRFDFKNVLADIEFDKAKGRFVLTEVAPGMSVDEVKAKTEAAFDVAASVKTVAV